MAELERSGMLDHLQQLRRGETTEPFEFCVFVSSGHNMSICAERARLKIEPKLRARFEAVRGGAGDAMKALDALHLRADEYIGADATSRSDINRGGSIHWSVLVFCRLEGAETFIAKLERYGRERAPAVTPADEERADGELNTRYRERLRALEKIDAQHLREAERAWITYRDAWISNYVKRWRTAAPPETLRREILTQLTRERTALLAEDAEN